MNIHLRMFAILRERTGVAETRLVLPDGSTVGAAIAEVGRRFERIIDLLPRTATAVNLQYAKPEHVLNDGDELALIPPVSGG